MNTSNAQKLRMSGEQICLHVQRKLFGVGERPVSNLGKNYARSHARCDIDVRYVLSFQKQSALRSTAVEN